MTSRCDKSVGESEEPMLTEILKHPFFRAKRTAKGLTASETHRLRTFLRQLDAREGDEASGQKERRNNDDDLRRL